MKQDVLSQDGALSCSREAAVSGKEGTERKDSRAGGPHFCSSHCDRRQAHGTSEALPGPHLWLLVHCLHTGGRRPELASLEGGARDAVLSAELGLLSPVHFRLCWALVPVPWGPAAPSSHTLCFSKTGR